ncbi:hypothetical protein AAVH_39469 [Aphelenchoides avenae]|nr:hypothetical protein AAVH_39469 [Aphelenchus avenae]
MAQISTATPLLVVPSFISYFTNLMTALGGGFDQDLDLHSVDCAKVGTLPAINITLGLPSGIT